MKTPYVIPAAVLNYQRHYLLRGGPRFRDVVHKTTRILTLQVSGLLDARAFVEETLEMAGQHAVVAQHLFHVELVEPLHVGRQVFDLLVGGRGGGRSGGLGQASVHGDAAQRDQKFSVHRDDGSWK